MKGRDPQRKRRRLTEKVPHSSQWDLMDGRCLYRKKCGNTVARVTILMRMVKRRNSRLDEAAEIGLVHGPQDFQVSQVWAQTQACSFPDAQWLSWKEQGLWGQTYLSSNPGLGLTSTVTLGS